MSVFLALGFRPFFLLAGFAFGGAAFGKLVIKPKPFVGTIGPYGISKLRQS